MKINNKRRRLFFLGATLAVMAVGLVLVGLLSKPPKTQIKNSTVEVGTFERGTVTAGRQTGDSKVLRTDSTLSYESEPLTTNQPNADAIGVRWDQSSSEVGQADHETEGVSLEVRTFDGRQWSNWVGVSGAGDRPDNQADGQAALVLTERAKQAQYRFVVTATDGRSPEIRNVRLDAIDATKGPDPTKPSLVAKLFGKTAQARHAGPRIYSRAEWGSPEPNSSPGWGPEYRPLSRAVVHHTASTVSPSSSAAAIRSIWYFHTYTNGWGDIGYNYLVDLNGNMFQGRYFDHAYASATNQDVVGGHAYGNNYGTSGIATLGNFTDQGVTLPMLDSIGNLAGYKAVPYNFNPGAGSNLVGHRDVGQTNCPGNNLYNVLGTVRNSASGYFGYYAQQENFQYSYQGQTVGGAVTNQVNIRTNQQAALTIDLKNEGRVGWSTGGANPVRLITDHPLGRASPVHWNWLTVERPGTFTGRVESNGTVTPTGTINPGETARFSFSVNAWPGTAGTYVERFRLVAENAAFMPDRGIFWQINVTPDVYNYSYQGQFVNGAVSNQVNLRTNQQATLAIDLANTGDLTWQNSGNNAVRLITDRSLGRASPVHWNWLSVDRPSTFTEKVTINPDGTRTTTPASAIAPGEIGRFTFSVNAWSFTPLTSVQYFRLVAENFAFMPDRGIFWQVNVTPDVYDYSYRGQTVGGAVSNQVNLNANQQAALTLDLKNEGNVAWQNSGTNVFRLITDRPLGRASPVHWNWITVTRPATFAGRVESNGAVTPTGTINSGETARFSFSVNAWPGTAGTYTEYFRAVAENAAFLKDLGIFWHVTVTP